MKHKTESEKLTNNQKLKGIRNVTSGKYLTSLIVRQDLKIPNIFLIQNKGKGPPGRTCSPGLVDYLTRANQPAAFIEPPPKFIEGNNTFNENELLIHTKPNHYSQLNFTIMKKRLFILILAVFAINVAYGQFATKGSDPIPLGNSCSDDALHPIPGKPYSYAVTGTGDPNGYTWWATKNVNFITSSPTTTTNIASMLTKSPIELIDVSANYGLPNSANTVSITWSSQILAGTASSTTPPPGKSPTFVVVKSEGTTNCSDNLKVYQLDPIFAFTVDILPMTTSATTTGNYSSTITECYANVESAVFNGGTVTYNYGTNVLYYEVVAANFTNYFNAEFQLSGLAVGQTADLAWSYTTGTSATYTDIATGVVGTGGTVSVTGTASATVDPSINTSLGASIYVRVTIHNGKYEGISDQSIALAVEGTDSEGNKDKDNNSCNVIGYEDVATETLTARPTIITNTTASPNDFVSPTP